MKYLLLVDLEGIIGITRLRLNKDSINLALYEINIIVDMLHSMGCSVSVCNVHNDGMCIPKSAIEGMGAILIQGLTELIPLVRDFDFAVMIGFHGKFGSGGRFDHSFRHDIIDVLYEGKSIGEVGIFYRWLLCNRVPTILVSGEGCFADEIDGYCCEIDVTNMSSNIEQDYLALKRSLAKALSNVGRVLDLPVPKSNKVLVFVDNPDKYQLLCDYQRFDSLHTCFTFPSLDTFISEMYTFCELLNNANRCIYKDNFTFLSNLKRTFSSCELRECLGDFSNVSIMDLSSSDREKILSLLHLKCTPCQGQI